MADPLFQPSPQPFREPVSERDAFVLRDACPRPIDDDERFPQWLAEALARRGIPPSATAHRLLDEHDLPSEQEEHLRVPLGTPHKVLCDGLYPGVKSRYAHRRDVVVAEDLYVYFERIDEDGKPYAGRLAPDLFVAFDVPLRDRQSYVAWQESIVPSFVLEVLSPSNWRNDVYRKPALYAEMGVNEYFMFDGADHIKPRLQGFVLKRGAYSPLPLETPIAGMRGICSKQLGLYLCHTEPWPDGDHELGTAGKLRWFDPAAGEILLTADERVAATEQAAAEQVAAANERAATAESRLAELQAQLAKLRR